jgi:PAS domain-containing protein
MEEKLKANDERSMRLLQHSDVATLVSRGLEQKVEFMNDKFTALFGYTIDDVPDVDHWWPLAYPDEAYRQAVRNEWQARVAEVEGPLDVLRLTLIQWAFSCSTPVE